MGTPRVRGSRLRTINLDDFGNLFRALSCSIPSWCFLGRESWQQRGERSVLSYTVKHLCFPGTWSYASESTAYSVLACSSDMSVVQTAHVSQVLRGRSWAKPVCGQRWGSGQAGLSSGHCHTPSAGNGSPQQIESVVSFNYFSRCHYQKFLCKYIFYSLRHVNMRPKL